MIRASTLALALLFASPIPFFCAQQVAAQDAERAEQVEREEPGASRSATFQAAQGAQTEDIPGGALLIAAYGIIWLLVLGFVGSLGVRHAQTQRELARLREDLKAHARKASGGPSPEEL